MCSCSPSSSTRPPRGSTTTPADARCRIICARPTSRQPRTATRRRRVGKTSDPASAAAALTNTTERSTAAAPMPPNCAAICRGSRRRPRRWGRRRRPRRAGRPSARGTAWRRSTPAATARRRPACPGSQRADLVGDPVGDRRVDRELREVAQHPRRCRRRARRSSAPPAFITDAIAKVRRIVSPARPIPCASRGRDGDDAEVVQDVLRGHRRRAHPVVREAQLAGQVGRSPWTATIIASCSATASRPYGSVGLVEEPITLRHARRACRTSGTCPPPQPSTW